MNDQNDPDHIQTSLSPQNTLPGAFCNLCKGNFYNNIITLLNVSVVFVKYLNITSFFSQSQYYRLHLKLFTQAV